MENYKFIILMIIIDIIILIISEILMKKYQEDSNQDIKESIKQIYSKQLYGFDIDPSVINLSKFIFLMKAIELCPTYLDDDNLVVPNFVCIQTPNIKRSRLHEVNVLIETMKDASLIGSLIQVPDYDYASLLQLVTCQEEKEIVELAILLKMISLLPILLIWDVKFYQVAFFII